MKAAKIMLAVLLAGVVVAAYLYFPNPLDEQGANAPAREQAGPN